MGQNGTDSPLPNWAQNNESDIEEILKRHLPWIQGYVHRKLGNFPRRKFDTGDIVQEAMVQFLKYGPRLQVTNDGQFRALLCRIVENVVCNQYVWLNACRRTIARERPLPSDTVLNLNPSEGRPETPSQIVNQQEEEAWLRLAIELLDFKHREVIIHRDWMGLSFSETAEQIGLSKAGARKRYYNAINELIEKVDALKNGRIDRVVGPDLSKEMEK